MEFRLLGVVEVRDGGELVTIGGLKSQVLFATLLLDHGRVVPAQRLVDAVWGLTAGLGPIADPDLHRRVAPDFR